MRLYDDSGSPRLAELAERQHGVVATRQLHALDYSRTQAARLVAKGHLVRIHRGVFAVGHGRLTLRGHWMAAVLAGGDGAVLSHRAAGALWELRRSESHLIDVTVARSKRGFSGVRFHRARCLDAQDLTLIDGIPVTALPRTLLDLAETLSPQQLRFVLEEAERREILDGRALEAMLARAHGRRGVKPLRAALRTLTGSAPWTLSELERAFLALIRTAGLPEPRTNVLVENELVDVFWPHAPLAVELDGLRFHRTRKAFEADRRKGNRLQLAGIPLLRVTQPRVEHEPNAVLSEVRAMLGGG